jgi:flavin-dependent dehydrogenase
METNNNYSCAIIGGGLAGLSLAIQLANAGIETILFEKKSYPFHKVCGEYISMESWNFLSSLGIPLAEMDLPTIHEVGISSEKGFMLNANLPLGGFGISRHTLDFKLYEIAKQKGVRILENCNVFNVIQTELNIQTIETSRGTYTSNIVCGTFGKYTPQFVNSSKQKQRNQENYIGVKYHIKTDLSPNRIELHNFSGGYCGISKVDLDVYCMCYLVNSVQLNNSQNDIKRMEERILFKNQFLEKYFTQAEFLFKEPLVISNVTFHKKATYSEGLFLLGDAAGSVTPLCGNGMSMALRASHIFAQLLFSFYEGNISKDILIASYENAWKQQFDTRIMIGYYLQGLFGKKNLTNSSLRFLHLFPSITQKIIQQTHGKRF